MKEWKKHLAAALSFLMLFVTAAPLPVSAALSGVDLRPDNAVVESGGQITYEIETQGEALDEDITVTLEDLLTETVPVYSVERVNVSSQHVTVTFPVNDSDWDKAYTVHFKLKGETICSANVTVESANASAGNPMIYLLSAEPHTIGEDGDYTVTCTLYGEDLDQPADVRVTLDGAVQALDPTFTETTATKQVFTLTFPENTGSKDLSYLIEVSPAGLDQWSHSASVISKPQSGGEVKEPVLGEIRSQAVGSDGLTYLVSFTGENLTEDNVFISVLPEQDVYITGKTIRENGGEFMLTFPANNSGKDKEYYLYISTSTGESKETLFTIKDQSQTDDREEIDLKPGAVVIDDSYQEITMTFGRDVMAGTEDPAELKEKISLQYGLNWQDLGENDEVVIDGSVVTIKLAQPYEPLFGGLRIKVDAGALAVSEDTLIAPFEWIVDDEARVTGIELSTESLPSEGGEVTASLRGYHLKDANITGRIVDVSTGISEPSIKVHTETNEQGQTVLRYTLPENRSDRTKSWLLKVTVNGVDVAEGMDYTDIAKRPLVSVLPAGVEASDITLGAMTINSYGINPDPNNLQYTETSTNQESKKIQVHLYGTNFDASKTKVKIVDQDGVEWPIYNVPQFDSVTYFIMVANDGTGITGNGNHQILEIICPRNIGHNRTYDIYVAPDGEHFVEDQHVTVCVRNDGESSTLDPVKRTVEVRYVDTEGREIAPSDEFVGYSWFFMADLGIEAKSVDGYKAVDVPTFEPLQETIGNEDRVVEIVYEKVGGSSGGDEDDPGDGEEVTPNDPSKDDSSDSKDAVTEGSGDESGDGKVEAEVVKTGDETELAGAASLLLISAAGLLGMAFYRRKSREEE